MKNILLSLLVLALSSPLCFAQVKVSSPAYDFGYDVIHAFSVCLDAMELPYSDAESASEVASMAGRRNATLENARSWLLKWQNSDVSSVALPAEMIYTGIGKQIQAYKQDIALYRDWELGNLSESDFGWRVEENGQLGWDAWDAVRASGKLVMWTMVKPKGKYKPTDRIPFSMTSAEKISLLNEIDKLFGDKLVQYTSDVADPEEADHVIALAVLRIKKLLKSITYAEAGILLYAKD